MSEKLHPVLWLWKSASEPIFSNADVWMLGEPALTQATLQNWANRGFVEPSIEVRNVKGRRRYSGGQLLQVIIGNRLVQQFGISPEAAILDVMLASLTLSKTLLGAGIKLAEVSKIDRVSFDLTHVDDYWAVSQLGGTGLRTVRLSDVPASLDKSAGSIVYPFGADLHQLARRAMLLRTGEAA